MNKKQTEFDNKNNSLENLSSEEFNNIGSTMKEIKDEIEELKLLIKSNEHINRTNDTSIVESNKSAIKVNDELKLKLNKVERQLNSALSKNSKLENEIDEFKSTMRYRLGDEIVSAFLNSPIRVIKLPFILSRLIYQGYKKVHSREELSNKSVKETKNTKNNTNKHVRGAGENNYKHQRILKKINEFNLNVTESERMHDIRVACILDTFSFECFKYECKLEQLKFNTWQKQIEVFQPDFLLVESAWYGVDNSWKFKLIDIQKKQNDCAIIELINYCKENKIKTVFWNKEDPPNYDRFIETAKLFDYVFTTEENIIPQYKNDLEHNHIYSLPFAAQQKIHNPINSNYKIKENVAFAGSWYRRHPERNNDMELLLDPASEFDLMIFDRFYNFADNDNYRFPDKYRDKIVCSLNYDDMLKAYKLFKVFLNVNTVSDSPTMYSRRVYELLASGTNVISTFSKGIYENFNQIVQLTSSKDDTKRMLRLLLNNPEYSERLSLLGIREVYSKHLYKHRLAYILDKISIDFKDSNEKESVTIVTSTNRSEYIDVVFNNYENQLIADKELIIILNDHNIDADIWNKKAEKYKNISIYQLSSEITLGDCLNYAIDKAKNKYIAKFDDDDYYGPNYLVDTIHAFQYSGADIVGKKTFFSYIENMKALALRYPNQDNKFTDFIHGGTIVFRKDIFDIVKFQNRNAGEDTAFLRECSLNGYKIYSTNKYNYTYIRKSDLQHHTWKIDDTEFLKNCSIIAHTDDYKTHVTV